jgi:hypothetical protein
VVCADIDAHQVRMERQEAGEFSLEHVAFSTMNDFVVEPARKRKMVEAILRVLPALATAIDALPECMAPR